MRTAKAVAKAPYNEAQVLDESILLALQVYDLANLPVVNGMAALVERFARNGVAAEYALVQRIEYAAVDLLSVDATDTTLCKSDLVNLTIDCGWFYERIGLFEKAQKAIETALTTASQQRDNQHLLRRAHNLLGALYAKTCMFAKSYQHFTRAFELSEAIPGRIYCYATLVNTVAMLHSMGLYRDAQKLALRNAEEPAGESGLEVLHFLNANNGAFISHVLGDLPAVRTFHEIATKKFDRASPHISRLSLAYYEANKATYLLSHDEVELALAGLDQAISRLDEDNVQVRAVLLSAQALVRVRTNNQSLIDDSFEKLARLLSLVSTLHEHRENVLRAMVGLCSTPRENDDKRLEQSFKRLLKEHVIAAKHSLFFTSREVQSLSDLTNPFYEMPLWISKFSAIKPWGGVPDDLDALDRSDLARAPQSQLFEIAQNWALAAEYTLEGSADHCYEVGALAGLIGRRLGLSDAQCLDVEFACRLHDVGKLSSKTTSSTRLLRSGGGYRAIREHVLAGAHLLSGSADRTLDLASEIAGKHHEWWNGTGLPDGLSKEAIPLEARICAVADAFVTLVAPSGSGRQWPLASALKQIICMSGMQFDPAVVESLVEVVNLGSGPLLGCPRDALGAILERPALML